MRPFCVFILAAKLTLSSALMSADLLEAPLDSGGLPYALAATGPKIYPEGTRCDVIGVRLYSSVESLGLIFVEKLGIAFYGIRTRREQCFSGLSVLGNSFEDDTSAQSLVPNCEKLPTSCGNRSYRVSFNPHIMLIAMNPDQTCRKFSAALT